MHHLNRTITVACAARNHRLDENLVLCMRAKRGIRARACAHAHLHVLTRSSPTAAVHALLVALFLVLSHPPSPSLRPLSTRITWPTPSEASGSRSCCMSSPMPAQQHRTSKHPSCVAAGCGSCCHAWRVRERIASSCNRCGKRARKDRRERQVSTPHTHAHRANTRPPPSHSPTHPSTHGHTQDQPQTSSTHAHTAARAP
jgi:hypothetical protein